MRLRTKLVLAASCLTMAIVLVLSVLFLGELLRQRIAQTDASDDVLARLLLRMTRQAIEVELPKRPPKKAASETDWDAAVAEALRSHQPLLDTMDSFVRYSPSVEDASVTDARGMTLVSTELALVNKAAPARVGFDRLRDGGAVEQVLEVFGSARVLDVSMPLDRNGKPFLVVHLGVRSSFLRNNYLPSLRDGLFLVLVCGGIAVLAAGVLASLALRPIEEISQRLERLARAEGAAGSSRGTRDTVARVTRTIERLGEQMQTTETGYTDLQANLTQMLDTLRDGVLLFTRDGRAAMASDAVGHFVETDGEALTGRRLGEIFKPETALGRAVLEAFAAEEQVAPATVRLEDGRMVEITLDHVGETSGRVGTLLTLHDTGSAMRLEKELEVARRLAAVGRLTAGVGHEVKNPINAMVVHLELLKGKLAAQPGMANGAARHVEIIAGEMQRLDRVVQTLADFTRPMELHVSDVDLSGIARAVMELTGAEMAEHGVRARCDGEPVTVRGDGELLRQALLNLVLNGVQAMPRGGELRVTTSREGDVAVLRVEDDGTGISPELMPRLFELYFTTKPRGSGIGLAITYRIVQMHGGAMDVQSETSGVKTGTAVTVRLPAIGPGASLRRLAAGRPA
jgi:signal transduction histidine kinase